MSRNHIFRLALVSLVVATLAGTCLVSAAGEPKRPTAEEAIRQALSKPVDLRYNKVPLGKVAEDLQAKLGVPVVVDIRRLEEIGLQADMPITFASSGVSARAAVALMLRESAGLVAATSHNVLLITTAEEADNIEKVGVYEVSGLVCHAGPLPGQPDFGQVINLVKSCVRPTSWPDANGAISMVDEGGINAIIFAQSEAVHNETAALLSQLRAVRHSPAAKTARPGAGATPVAAAIVKPILLPLSPAEAAIRRALARPIDLKYENVRLKKVAEDLQARLGVPVRLDKRSLAEVGASAQESRSHFPTSRRGRRWI